MGVTVELGVGSQGRSHRGAELGLTEVKRSGGSQRHRSGVKVCWVWGHGTMGVGFGVRGHRC